MSALATLTNKLATRLEMGDGKDLIDTLKATAFKGPVTDAQMTALMVVANQYGLNPWTREIYAFPDKNNGIVPVVGVDGWSRIINNHPQFDGIEFEQDDESCTCIIFRKDRSRPIKVTEYKVECTKKGFGPWETHPKRMMRHKSLIQCARLAFGYGGIYDADEAANIIEINGSTGEATRRKATKEDEIDEKTVIDVKPELPAYSDESFQKNKAKWRESIIAGDKSVQNIIDFISKKALLSKEQLLEIDSYAHEND